MTRKARTNDDVDFIATQYFIGSSYLLIIVGRISAIVTSEVDGTFLSSSLTAQ